MGKMEKTGECTKLCELCITKSRLEKWEGKGL